MAHPVYDLSRNYTVDEVLAFPDDGNRYELVDGLLLVSPSPSKLHQQVLSTLHLAFGNYLKLLGLFKTLFFAPADITFSPKTLVQPDLFLIYPDDVKAVLWKEITQLRFALEVISRSTQHYDRFHKRVAYQRVAYQRYGVETYWIVDPYKQQAEVWTPDTDEPVIETKLLMWAPEKRVNPLVIDLEELWMPE